MRKIDFPDAQINGPFQGVLIEGKRLHRLKREISVYDMKLRPLPHATDYNQLLTTVAATDITLPARLERIAGPVLYCGLTFRHFGHILISVLGRLWAIEHLPPDVKLLFIVKKQYEEKHYELLKTLLESLGICNEIIFSRGPLEFEAIYTAPELFGERYDCFGAPEFFKWIDDRLPPAFPVEIGKRLYITRSGLGAKAGRFACEDHLETLLQDYGYEIFMPEKHSLQDQAKAYQSAECLIFAEGSAAHWFGFMRRPEQRVGMIKRRPEEMKLICNHLNARPGPEAAIIDAIENVFWRPERGGHLGVSVLDFAKIETGLVEAGLIEASGKWIAPSPSEEKASLEAGLEADEKMLSSEERAQFLQQLRKRRQMARKKMKE